MRHHLYNPDFEFVKEPEEFNKYTELETLKYCLGATMYMPGNKDFTDAILNKKYPGLTSMVMCFEDACKEEDVPEAENNCIKMFSVLSKKLDSGEITYADIPILIVRVRNIEQFRHFASMLKPEYLKVLAGFNFPKFNSENGEEYYSILKDLNQSYGEILYGMPILEDTRIAYKENRTKELMAVKEILDRYNEYVLNVRVGCTDFSSYFGLRRDVNYTIYDIIPVREILTDILNVFIRNNTYTVSGPVWEYFRINKKLRFTELPSGDLQESLLNRTPLINSEIDGLLREIILDKANGFIGKTIIHPSHINYVNGLLAVTKGEYEDALQILDVSGGVIKSTTGNRMNEIGPHHRWAEKILYRAKCYGVIEKESSYLKLFGAAK